MPSSRRTQTWALGLAATASFMVVLDLLVVSTALSTIQRDLGASLEQLEWTVNAYTLSFAVLLMTASALGDRFGRGRGDDPAAGAGGAQHGVPARAPRLGDGHLRRRDRPRRAARAGRGRRDHP